MPIFGRKTSIKNLERIRRWEGADLMSRLAEKSPDGKVRGWKVPKDLLHDYTTALMIVGCDVEQLYPSMEMKLAAKLIEEAILNSEVEWKDLECVEGARMIEMNKDEDWIRENKLEGLVPNRRKRLELDLA